MTPRQSLKSSRSAGQCALKTVIMVLNSSLGFLCPVKAIHSHIPQPIMPFEVSFQLLQVLKQLDVFLLH